MLRLPLRSGAARPGINPQAPGEGSKLASTSGSSRVAREPLFKTASGLSGCEVFPPLDRPWRTLQLAAPASPKSRRLMGDADAPKWGDSASGRGRADPDLVAARLPA